MQVNIYSHGTASRGQKWSRFFIRFKDSPLLFLLLQDLYLWLLRKVREHTCPVYDIGINWRRHGTSSAVHLLVGRPDKELAKGCQREA